MIIADHPVTSDQNQTADAERLQQGRSRAASHFTFED